MFPKLSGKGLQRVVLPLAFWFSCHFAIQADDWPNWSGPYHDGISRETDFADTWPKEGLPIEWTREIGTGFSSVSVAGQSLFSPTGAFTDGTRTVNWPASLCPKKNEALSRRS